MRFAPAASMEIGFAFQFERISYGGRIQVVHLLLQRRGRIFAELPFQVLEPSVKLGGLLNNLRIQGGGKFSQNLLGLRMQRCRGMPVTPSRISPQYSSLRRWSVMALALMLMTPAPIRTVAIYNSS